MTTEIILAIITGVTTILSGSGLGLALFYRKENKQLKAVEVSDKKQEVEAKRLENELKQADWEHERYLEEKRISTQREYKIQQLYKGIGELKDKYRDKCDEVAALTFMCEKKDWFRCDVNDCPHRIPPRDYTKLQIEQDTLVEKYKKSNPSEVKIVTQELTENNDENSKVNHHV